MWQRIQTIFLAISLGLTCSLFFCNLSTVIGPDGEEVVIRYSEKIVYLVLTIITAIVGLIALSTFKFRLFQMRTAILAALLLLGIQGVIVYDFVMYHKEMVFSFTAVFPILGAILDFLAARKIFQDEIMVRASARLRDTRKKRRR